MIDKILKLSILSLKIEKFNNMKILISKFNPSENLENLLLSMTKLIYNFSWNFKRGRNKI